MKQVIALLLFVLGLVDCQSSMKERVTKLDAPLIRRINKQLSNQSLVHKVLMNKIDISCQNKYMEMNRALSREEYLSILRDEHFLVLPQEMQEQKDALEAISQIVGQDSIAHLLETNPTLALPLANTYGSRWIHMDKQSILERRKQGHALVKLFKEERLVNEQEYEAIAERIEKSNMVFPYQLYELILKGLQQ